MGQSMGKYKLPLILAIAGFSIGVALCAAWFYVGSHDVFTKRVYWHSRDGQASGFYTPAYDHFQTLTFVLCPTSAILIVSMDFTPSRATTITDLVLWFIAALLNGLLYLLVGLLIACLWEFLSRKVAGRPPAKFSAS